MIPLEWLELARVRIDAHVRRTPLTYDERRGLHIKWENQQVTGSFKARGAFNKVLSLDDWERSAGLVAVSAGNHGLGVALAAQMSQTSVEVFVPEHAVPIKVEAMRALNAQVIPVRGGYADAEAAGRAYASDHGKTWISPYNDGQVIAGQGTVALEILESLRTLNTTDTKGHKGISFGSPPSSPSLPSPPGSPTGVLREGAGGEGTHGENPPVWVVPVGGGGLISGVGAALKAASPKTRLIGVQSEASAFAHGLFHHGSQEGIEDRPTLADGLADAVESDSVTVPLMHELVDDMLLVSEQQTAQAVAFAWHAYSQVIEGSAAVALAACLSGMVGKGPAVTVMTGGNLQPEVHAGILEQYPEKPWL